MTALLLGLLTLNIVALAAGGAGRSFTAMLLLGNWAVNTAFCTFTGDPFPWPFFIITDWLTGIALFAFRSSRWQSWILLTYAAQLVAHAAFGLSPSTFEVRDRYWLTLYGLAWLQIAIVGGWIVHDYARRRAGLVRGGASGEPSAASERRS